MQLKCMLVSITLKSLTSKEIQTSANFTHKTVLLSVLLSKNPAKRSMRVTLSVVEERVVI